MAEIARRRARPLLGTRVSIQVRDAGPMTAAVDAAIDDAFAVIADVQRRLSRFDADSILSRVNRDALCRPVPVDADTAAVIEAALAFARDSDGAFDPCAGEGGWRDVEVDRDVAGAARLRFHRPLRLDLGGIAKGHAVDQAVTALRAAGIHAAMVEAGGDLRAFGASEWRIALRDPRPSSPAALLRISVRDTAVASSAATFTPAGDGAHRGLVDRGGRRALGEDGVSVQASSARVADALTKVVLFAEPVLAEALLRRHDAAALRFDSTMVARAC